MHTVSVKEMDEGRRSVGSTVTTRRLFNLATLLCFPLLYGAVVSCLYVLRHEVFAGGNWGMAPLGVVAAIVATATPVGGAIVFFPILVRTGLSPASAIAFSFAIQTMGMGMGALTWVRRGAVPIGLCASLLPWCLAGFGLGAFVVNIDSDMHLRILFSTVGLSLALFLVKTRFHLQGGENDDPQGAVSTWPLWLCAFLGGWLTAQIGLGVDLIVFFLLWKSYRMSVRDSTAISVCLMAATASAGFLYLGIVATAIPWQLWVWAVPGVLLGGLIGPRINERIGGKGILIVLSMLLIAEFLTTMFYYLKIG